MEFVLVTPMETFIIRLLPVELRRWPAGYKLLDTGYKKMTKTIILTDLVVDYIHADYENERVLVGYRMTDDTGTNWESGEAIFWVTMPAEPTDKDFQLPDGYIATLVQLGMDADAALTSRFLV
jgi:hypothetical protein